MECLMNNLYSLFYFYNMNSFKDFEQSLNASAPSPELSIYLQSLWYDGKDDWNKAHIVIQDVEDKTAAWIHAYLHRKEGDDSNADYWYSKAGRKKPTISLKDEWKEIVNTLLV
jgi:hypothetical protein